MHSVDELFAVVVSGQDDDARWSAIRALHALGTREVFERAGLLCVSSNAAERVAGVDVVGQLNAFDGESLQVLLSMLDDPAATVVEAVVLAIGQRQEPGMIDALSIASRHQAANVRWAVANALEDLITEERAEKLLLALMRDDDNSVRDRATFAVGSLSDRDTPRIRAALVERLSDGDQCVANEAALGLARRRDARAIPYIAGALADPDCDIEEAADEITSLEMLGELLRAREVLGDHGGLHQLIERCRARD